MKKSVLLFISVLLFLSITVSAVSPAFAQSEFGDLGDVEGIYQGLYPLILAVGFVLFLIAMAYKLLGQDNPIKL